jgi:hypothetical protein
MWSLHFGLLYELCFALTVLLIFFLPNRLFFLLCQCVYIGVMFIADLDLCDLGFKAFSSFVNGCYIVLCFFFSYLC